MIVRQWRGWSRKDRAAEYIQYFATKVQAHLRAIQGYRKAILLTKEHAGETEIITMTFFDRLEDVAAFAGKDYDVANVSEEAQGLLAHYEKTVTHFEVALEGEATQPPMNADNHR